MFESELDTNDIAMEFNMEKSYLDLNVDWVKLDPSRLLQVLINLTTVSIMDEPETPFLLIPNLERDQIHTWARSANDRC